MDYDVWIYNWIPNTKYGLSSIYIRESSIFDPALETLSNCHVWGCPTYVLELKFQNPGVKFLSGIPVVKCYSIYH